MGLRVAELETLFTGDVTPFEKAAAQVEAKQKQLDGKTATVNVNTDAQSAMTALQRIESEARALPDGQITVDADTGGARRALDSLGDDAESSLSHSGDSGGKAFMGGLLGGLASTPIAGIFVGLGQDALDAFTSGFQVEVRSDRFAAQTGLDPVTVAKVARAAGEAYADNWGDSIEANMASARNAIQAGLLDPDATKRDSQAVISSLAGVADVLEDDVERVSRSAATLLKNGLAKNADEAFDIIVKGQQSGLNVSEDWLDTINEYSVLWSKLGLDAPTAMGLMRQAVQAGARDTDKAADALKEFQIRATDASDSSAVAFEQLGLNAEEMTAKIAAGGDGAAEGLAIVLDRLRDTEDPVLRNAAAVGLFGTQAEDLGDALYSMDASNAVQQLGDVAGAAETALSVLTDNTQNDIDAAQRNIELAADGIKGALAGAFGEPLEAFSGWVTENRGPVMQFLLDVANGGIDLGRGVVEGMAASTEAVGGFVGGPLATLADNLADVLDGLSVAGFGVPGAQQGAENLRNMASGMRDFKDDTEVAADTLRTNLIEKGLDPIQEKLNEVGEQLVWEAEVHDAQVRLASEIDSIGTAAEDGANLLADYSGRLDVTTTAGKEAHEQLNSVRQSMLDQAEAAERAGESNEEMKETLNASRDALIQQLEAMGLTKEEAKKLADQYGLIPEDIVTTVEAKTAAAQAEISNFITANNGRTIGIKVQTHLGESYMFAGPNSQIANARGNLLVPMAAGGIPGTPLDPVAQMVQPGTLRVVGDRQDVTESYIPHDGSARSRAILAETNRLMGGSQQPVLVQVVLDTRVLAEALYEFDGSV